MKMKGMLFCAILGGLLTCVLVSADRKSPGNARLLGLSNSWHTIVRDNLSQQKMLTRELISVAKDKKRSADDRRRAIILLGELGNEESLDYLVENMGLVLPMEVIKGDADEMKAVPCVYVLAGIEDGRQNWNAIPKLLNQVERGKLDKALSHVSLVLRRICGKKVALALVNEKLSNIKGKPSESAFRELAKILEG